MSNTEERIFILEEKVKMLQFLVRAQLHYLNVMAAQIHGKPYNVSEMIYRTAQSDYRDEISSLVDVDPYLQDKIDSLLKELGLSAPDKPSDD